MREAIEFITPAITPLDERGRVDIDGALSLYNHLERGGIDGVLVFGSIGEFFAFSIEEKKRLITEAAKNHGRLKLIIGVSSMLYKEVVELSRYAFSSGADGVMIVSPYYFPLSSEAQFSYYKRLASEIEGPLYLYNFPDRTGYSLSAETVKRLALECPNIVGIKDTVPGMDHTRALIDAVKPVREDFLIYSGFDENFVHNVMSGGNGCVSGLSNIWPSLEALWTKSVREHNYEEASRIQKKVDFLMSIYSVAPSFIPVIKEAVRMKGIIESSKASFPFGELTKEERAKLERIIEEYEESESISNLS